MKREPYFEPKVKHVGFTGTRIGMTERQMVELDLILTNLVYRGYAYAHHGDCVGADSEFHSLAKKHGYKVVIHPPSNWGLRAQCDGDELRSPLPYLERNHEIVRSCDIIIATPKERIEVMRSGTWATIRFARKLKKELKVVLP